MSAVPPPKVRVEGSAVGVPESHLIYVIARPQTGDQSSRWIASDPVTAALDGFWQVDLQLPPEVPMPCRFQALALDGDVGVVSEDPVNTDSEATFEEILSLFSPAVLALSEEVVGP
jgi:hypothetical protein